MSANTALLRRCRHCRVLLLLLLLLLPMLVPGRAARPRSPWLGALGALLEDCPRDALAGCARRRALAAIDRILEDDTVPLVEGLELVKLRERTANDSVTVAVRDLLRRVREGDCRTAPQTAAEHEWTEEEEEEEEGGWRARLTRRLARALGTHAVRIDAERLARWAGDGGGAAVGQVESRGRRRRRRQMQMMPIVMMGVLLMGSVLIPMGFQFLAVLGGKALILAKMALMLSSIQGLKKIATNGVNYGLYHSPVPEPWHERSTAGAELPAYYAAPGYLDPAGLGYLQAGRRSAAPPSA
ncbi:uncharacterized protein LOC131673144 [Phymastichus coffea]|uniref:uncharacterized protein LOC131673144 n=1 Tax=Phymastichus coffea TaxID=108790 RepID=UPI00273C6003|nr:uncharacterized protein LOC131673144 [Phymastichus coffea]